MTPKNPTNTDLLKEIRELKGSMTIIVKDVEDLKNWRIAVEAAKQALKEYQDMKAEKTEMPTAKALAAVIGVIGLLSAVILALLNSK